MSGDIICIDDSYPQQDIEYMNKHGVVWPLEGKIYSVRSVVKFLVGERGVLLNEIKNPSTPKVSPSMGFSGQSETAFKISRFRNLDGTEIQMEELNSIKSKA